MWRRLDSLTFTQKVLFCLLSNTNTGMGGRVIAQYESAGNMAGMATSGETIYLAFNLMLSMVYGRHDSTAGTIMMMAIIAKLLLYRRDDDTTGMVI